MACRSPSRLVHQTRVLVAKSSGHQVRIPVKCPWTNHLTGNPRRSQYFYFVIFFSLYLQTSLDNICDSFLLRNSQLLDTVLEQAIQKALGKIIQSSLRHLKEIWLYQSRSFSSAHLFLFLKSSDFEVFVCPRQLSDKIFSER